MNDDLESAPAETTRDVAAAGGLRRRHRGTREPLVLSDAQVGLVERVVGDSTNVRRGKRRLVLAVMSMGTGKTLAALATLCVLRARASPRRVRALFVVPKSTLHDAWRRQIAAFTRLTRGDVKVVTYSRLQTAFSEGWTRLVGKNGRRSTTWTRTTGHRLLERRRDLVVFDESHTLRNADTILARAARVVTSRASHVLCMTGTPVHNGMRDADEQVRAMMGGGGRDDDDDDVFRGFAERYVYSATIEDAGVILPEKRSVFEWVDHEFDAREARAYNASLARVGGPSDSRDSRGGPTNKNNAHHMLILRQLCVEPALFHKHGRSCFDAEARRLTVASPGPKLRAALELVRRLTFEGHAKIVVVSEFVGLLDVFGDLLLDRAREPSLGFDGRLSSAERRRVVREFLEGDARIMRLSLGAGAYGLSLVPGPTAMIVMDVWYNPAVHRQVESRIHRLGQTRAVVVHTLVTRDSVESAILETHDAKEACASALFETKKTTASAVAVGDDDGGKATRIAEKCARATPRR